MKRRVLAIGGAVQNGPPVVGAADALFSLAQEEGRDAAVPPPQQRAASAISISPLFSLGGSGLRRPNFDPNICHSRRRGEELFIKHSRFPVSFVSAAAVRRLERFAPRYVRPSWPGGRAFRPRGGGVSPRKAPFFRGGEKQALTPFRGVGDLFADPFQPAARKKRTLFVCSGDAFLRSLRPDRIGVLRLFSALWAAAGHVGCSR